ncbi:MAG: tRNA preQ1(34) S-adenosylmethionine ribosyltransferase-isomerase QueA [Anaerolineae bacterium]|nr:tRNA preQ1(34) S-adenosylmethionine ribosyltransferase-isomerase QueA [Anaerolineae bacterium]
MKTSDFDYHLPPELIAQTPLERRDASRLLVLDRKSGAITHTHFNKIADYLRPGDLLVANRTRVIPARLYARKASTGGKVELLLLNRRDERIWEALVGGKRVKAGVQLELDESLSVEVIEELDGPRRLVRFDQPVEQYLERIGHAPLPPYIHTHLDDPERYQTVYAQEDGSAAAPTAGLHFTLHLLKSLKDIGIDMAALTLHVGLDTFAPVNEDDPEEHHIHSEWCQLTPETVERINQTRNNGGRIVAVGTTSVRTLESAAACAEGDDFVAPFEGPTSLFIMPGYQFQAVDALITNFHLPRSTLLMLVSAFAGRETILQAYQEAIAERYRFYSFGDAMLIL